MQHPSQLDTAVRYLEALGGAVIATDPLGRIIYWNPGAERQFGWVQAEVMGHSILEVTPSFVARAGHYRASLLDALVRVIVPHTRQSRETRVGVEREQLTGCAAASRCDAVDR